MVALDDSRGIAAADSGAGKRLLASAALPPSIDPFRMARRPIASAEKVPEGLRRLEFIEYLL
jgi:hypothetical protein